MDGFGLNWHGGVVLASRDAECVRPSALGVAVVVVCEDGGAIVGAADRLITSRFQGESERPKARGVMDGLCMVLAGDMVMHEMAQNPLWGKIGGSSASGATGVADRYAANLRRAWLFLRETGNAWGGLVPEIPACALFCGFSGGKPLVLKADAVSGLTHECTGFLWASLGNGGVVAESDLLSLRRYVGNASVEEALFRVLCAKKRAECASGVGKHTDLFVQRPGVPLRMVNAKYVGMLEKRFEDACRASLGAFAKAVRDLPRLPAQA